MTHDLAFLGAGNMAEAIARGLITTQTVSPDRLIAADPVEARRQLFATELKVQAVDSAIDAARDASAVLLAVKPQQIGTLLPTLGNVLSEQTLVISIAAGVTADRIERGLGNGKSWRVVRTMPNTPMLVGQGAVALAPGRHASAADVAAARRFFEPAAVCVDVTEDQLDAVTALSGSGPAYVFYLLEHMTAAGIALGLPAEHADLLARQTVYGSARMAKQSDEAPASLRKKVTSPNGTTQAAIESFDASGVGSGIESGLKAARDRSVQLGQSAK